MALKKIKQVKNETYTCTLMATTESDEPQWVHIDNHATKESAVLVPFCLVSELINEAL